MSKTHNTNYKLHFKKDKLPNPITYYSNQGLKLIGGGEWKSAICPFHEDKRPSLRLHTGSGGFRCMACSAHGGDILAFHMQRYQMNFINAARALGALEE